MHGNLHFALHRSQFLSNLGVRTVLTFEYKGKKVIMFVFEVFDFFMVKFSFENESCRAKQRNCRAKCKLPCKGPGPTALLTLIISVLPIIIHPEGLVVLQQYFPSSAPVYRKRNILYKFAHSYQLQTLPTTN